MVGVFVLELADGSKLQQPHVELRGLRIGIDMSD
jgi:hypothetical protein